MSLSKNDYRYFLKARNVANSSDFAKIHVGCIAVYQGTIIGVGYNTNKTHPMQNYYNHYRKHVDTDLFNPKLHAEINCLNSIQNLNINFSKVKLYIYRIRHDQDYGMSRPCLSCMAAIKDFGIKQIYYTTNDGYAFEKIENN